MISDKTQFTLNLLKWYHPNNRPLPWKNEPNPYKVWLSEIILQQTRVDQGLQYYLKFIEHYPTVEQLSLASEDEVLKLWQGLGYYSRARNLHASAQHIHNNLNGAFPTEYKEILKLKGVGTYTAAAIASFVYNQPYAVVDGNVFRVLARYFGIKTATDSTEGIKAFNELANQLLDKQKPGKYNQAIMDFGATVCKPMLPICTSCPLSKQCVALKENLVDKLPVKNGKIKVRSRYFHYMVIKDAHQILLSKREENDIWRNLYEFPMLEADAALTLDEVSKTSKFINLTEGLTVKKMEQVGNYTQKLTHQKIHGIFFELTLTGKLNDLNRDATAIDIEKIDSFAFPKIVNCYLEDNTLYLNNSQSIIK